MVLVDGTWRIGRVAEDDTDRNRKLVCTAHNMQADWYESNVVLRPERA